MIDRLLARLCLPYLDRYAPRGPAVDWALASFAISLSGAAMISRHFVWLGLGVFAFGVVLAALAEHRAPHPLGFLFHATRFAALPFAFALDNPERAVAMIFLSFALTVEMVARLKAGPEVIGGWIGTTELLLLFVLLAIFSGGLIAYLAGMLCFVSAGAAARRIV